VTCYRQSTVSWSKSTAFVTYLWFISF
jgi:hypothetical protein